MNHIRPDIIDNFPGAAKQTLRVIYQSLRQNRTNHALTLLNTWIARVIIKLIWIYVPSGNIVLIRDGIPRNTKNFKKSENNQLAQLWVVFKHDYQRNQNLFTKYS